MRTTATAVLAVAAAIPLTFLAAAPASAAPGDITAVFTTAVNPDGLSNTVTGTFTPTGTALPYYCAMYDRSARDANGYYLLEADTNGDPTPSITLTDTDVPDGTYAIHWGCSFQAVSTGP
ncbi:hypothetical protein ACFVX3_33015 [Rhodococcus erythropolis]